MFAWKSRTFTVRGRTFTHQYVDHPQVACIVPVGADDRYLLVRQYRAALDAQTLEFPAGKLEAGEDLETGARRELAEETGYHAGRLTFQFSFYPVAGYSNELIHVFHAYDLTPGDTNFDDSEDLVSVWMTPLELDQAIASGQSRDAKTMLAYFALRQGFTAPKPTA